MTIRFGRVEVRFGIEDPSVLEPAVVHALVTGWFDERLHELGWDPDRRGHDSGVKPYSVTPPYLAADGSSAIEVRVLDERLVPGVGNPPPVDRPVKVTSADITAVALDPAWSIAPADLLAQSAETVNDMVDLHFESPAVERRRHNGKRDGILLHEPLHNPGVLVGGLRRWWNLLARHPDAVDVFAPHLDLARTPPVLTGLELRSVELPHAGVRDWPAAGSVGWMRVALRGARTRDQHCALQQVAAIAPWAGCGAFTTWGLGATSTGGAD